jgi:hypothetical protein
MTVQIAKQNIEWFINTVLLGDLKAMICNCSLHYLGFGTVACGTEFLGACMDDKPFDQQGLSRQRFETAITMLFDCRYHQYASKGSEFDLYRHLRCGMAHIMRPQGKIAFTSHAESVLDKTQHLEVHTELGKLILISESFYFDFADACRKLKQDMSANRYSKKLTDEYLPIAQIEP